MRMLIPQPVQLWLNSVNQTQPKHLKTFYQPAEARQTDGTTCPTVLMTNNLNSLMLNSLESLLMQTISTIPPPDGAVEVSRKLCTQLLNFYRKSIRKMKLPESTTDDFDSLSYGFCMTESQLVTFEMLPTIVHVYLFLQATLFFPEIDKEVSVKAKRESVDLMAFRLMDFKKNKRNLLKKRIEDNFETADSNSEVSFNMSFVDSDQPKSEPEEESLGTRKTILRATELKPARSHASPARENSAKPGSNSLLKSERRKQQLIKSDTSKLLEILETFLIGFYNCTVLRDNLLSKNSSERIAVPMPFSLETPTIYCDSLSKSENAQSSGESRMAPAKTKLRDESPLPIKPSSESLWSDKIYLVCEESSMQLAQNIDSSNRMHILAAIIKEFNAISFILSSRAKKSLCNLAQLLSLKRRTISIQDNTKMKQSTDNLITESYVNNQKNVDPNSKELKLVSSPTLPHSHDFDYKSPTSKCQDATNQLKSQNEGSLSPNPNRYTRSTISELSKRTVFIHGLHQRFLLELLDGLYPLLFTDLSNYAYQALIVVEERATRALWSKALLYINASKEEYNRFQLSKHSIPDNEQPVDSKSLHLKPTESFNAKQLSLVNAYCGLWSDLLEKRSRTTPATETTETIQTDTQDIDPNLARSLHYVRIAQAKFKQSIVTNSNFKSIKPPDDIAPPVTSSDSKQHHSTSFLRKSSEQVQPFAHDWKGSVEDLILPDQSTGLSTFSREWFKKTLWQTKC